LPCSTVSINNGYCFGNGKVSKKIINGSSYSCEKVVDESKNEKGKVILLNGPEKAENIGIGTEMYYCDRNNSCRVTQGYYKSDSNVWYKCDNIRCDEIKGNDVDSIGDLSSSGVLKLENDSTGGVGTSTSPKYYYISGSNSFPGAESSESVLIEAGKNYFVVFKGKGYYLINGNGNGIEDKDPQDEIENEKLSSARKRGGNSGNTLYLCNTDDLTCKKVQNPGNGYYVNGATAVPNKPEIKNVIIVCSNGDCVIVGSSKDSFFPEALSGNEKGYRYRSIVFKKTGCDERYIGKLIRDSNNKNVKLCTSKTGSQPFPTNGSVKYYNVTITSGNKFCGVEISNAKDKKNDKVNILIRIDDKSMVQYNNEGYILYNSSGDILDRSKKSSQGNLSYCEDKVYSGGLNTVQCNVVSNIKNGWYFSKNIKDNSFIECTTSGSSSAQCVIKEAEIAEECRSSGSIVYNDGKYKMCETLKKQVVVPLGEKGNGYKEIVNVSGKKEFPGVGTDDTDIIVEIDKYCVNMIKWDSYKIVNEDDKKIIDTVGINEIYTKAGLLYKCEANGRCERIGLPNKNWNLKKNLKNLADELIYYKGDEDNSNASGARCVANVKSTAGFYVSPDKQKPIIQCIQTGLKLNGVLNTENNKVLCYEREMKEGWMLNSRVSVKFEEKNLIDKESTYMINCSQENGCQELEIGDVNNGWYMNAGYDYDIEIKKNNDTEINNYYPIIQCTSGGCYSYSEAIKDKCTKGGEIIYSSKKYKLYLSGKATGSVKFEEVNGKEYQMVKIENYGDFSDGDTSAGSYVLVEITKNEVQQRKYEDNYEHYVLKEKNMYKCKGSGCSLITDESNNEKTVLEELSGQLYTASSCSSSGCKWTNSYNKEAIIFLDKSRKIFTNKIPAEQPVTEIQYVYKCKVKSVCVELYNGEKGIYTEGYFYNPKHYDQSTNKETDTLYYFYYNGDNDQGWKIIGKDDD